MSAVDSSLFPSYNRSHSLCRGGTKVAPAVLGRRLQKRGRRVDGVGVASHFEHGKIVDGVAENRVRGGLSDAFEG